MVWIPQSTHLFGPFPVAAPICQLLELLFDDGHLHTFDELHEYLTVHKDDADSVLTVLVSDGGDGMPPEMLSNQVNIVRLHRDWRGALLVIMPEWQTRLVEAGYVFSLQSGSENVGQTCLPYPVSLPCLCRTLACLRPFSRRAWGLVRQCLNEQARFPEIWRKYTRILNVLRRGEMPLEDIRHFCQSLFHHERLPYRLLGHDDRNAVRAVARLAESANDRLTPEEVRRCEQFLQNIMRRIPAWE